MHSSRRTHLKLLGTLLAGALPLRVLAQDAYPNRAIRVIVPQPPRRRF